MGEFFLLILNVIILTILFCKNRRKSKNKKKSGLILFHWERTDYLSKVQEERHSIEPKSVKKTKKKSRKKNNDDYLEKLNFGYPEILEEEDPKKIKSIDSDHEELNILEEEEVQGGVGLTDQVRTRFTKKNIKIWLEFWKKYQLCRCHAPVECSVKEKYSQIGDVTSSNS